MAHGHHHPGESVSAYFTEQLLTLLVAGLFGYAAVQLYLSDRLQVLAQPFHIWVLVGGITVLVLVLLRGIAVWKEAGEIQAAAAGGYGCGINHQHGADCSHDPGIGGADEADHSHSHDMSWVFARMLILVFPVMLFFLGLPNAGFSKDAQNRMLGNDQAMGTAELKELAKDAEVLKEEPQPDGSVVRTLKAKSGLQFRSTTPAGGGQPTFAVITGTGTQMRFNDLNDAAFDEGKRNALEGQTAILDGRFKRLADKEFTLFRLKMTCCAADTVPLKVRIIVPQAINTFEDFSWVQVKGQIQFFKVPAGKDGSVTYIPVIMVADINDVKPGQAQNEYES